MVDVLLRELGSVAPSVETSLSPRHTHAVEVAIPAHYVEQLTALSIPSAQLCIEFYTLQSLYQLSEADQALFVETALGAGALDILLANFRKIDASQHEKIVKEALRQGKITKLIQQLHQLEGGTHEEIVRAAVGHKHFNELLQHSGALSRELQKRIVNEALSSNADEYRLITCIQYIDSSLHEEIVDRFLGSATRMLVSEIENIKPSLRPRIVEQALEEGNIEILSFKIEFIDQKYHEQIVERALQYKNTLSALVGGMNRLSVALQRRVIEEAAKNHLLPNFLLNIDYIDPSLHELVVRHASADESLFYLFHHFSILSKILQEDILRRLIADNAIESAMRYLLANTHIINNDERLYIAHKLKNLGVDVGEFTKSEEPPISSTTIEVDLVNYNLKRREVGLVLRYAKTLPQEVVEQAVNIALEDGKEKRLIQFLDVIDTTFHRRIVHAALKNDLVEQLSFNMHFLSSDLQLEVIIEALRQKKIDGPLLNTYMVQKLPQKMVEIAHLLTEQKDYKTLFKMMHWLKISDEELREMLPHVPDITAVLLDMYQEHYYTEIVRILKLHPHSQDLKNTLYDNVYRGQLQKVFDEIEHYKLAELEDGLLSLCRELNIPLTVNNRVAHQEERLPPRTPYKEINLIPAFALFELDKSLGVKFSLLKERQYEHPLKTNTIIETEEFSRLADRAEFSHIEGEIQRSLRELYTFLKEYIVVAVIAELLNTQKETRALCKNNQYEFATQEEIVVFLYRAKTAFIKHFIPEGGTFGGKLWSDICGIALEIWMVDNPTMNDMIAFIDRCLQIQHNTGYIFDKDFSRVNIESGEELKRFLDNRRRYSGFDQLMRQARFLEITEQKLAHYQRMNTTLDRLADRSQTSTRPVGGE